MKPSIGRIVHVVQKGRYAQTLIHLPAVITAVWGDTCVNLQVFTDGTNSEPHPGENLSVPSVKWLTSVTLDETAQTERSWHWPERE